LGSVAGGAHNLDQILTRRRRQETSFSLKVPPRQDPTPIPTSSRALSWRRSGSTSQRAAGR
jgi:hypothetical protein